MSKFIVFEGIDGCGKSTQAQKLSSYLFDFSKNNSIFLTREPTKDFKEIREKIHSTYDVHKDAYWYLEAFVRDRENHLKTYIKPMLDNGIYVISDRYDLSTYVYQYTQGVTIENIKEAHQNITSADVYIVLDCPVDIAYKRRSTGGKVDGFDKDLDFQKQLRENYLKISSLLPEKNIHIVDSTATIDKLFKKIIHSIKPYL